MSLNRAYFKKYTKSLLKHKVGDCPLISQSCDSEAVVRRLIEILGTRWLPKGIIELFAGVVWQKDTNIWLWFIFSFASCVKLQDEVDKAVTTQKWKMKLKIDKLPYKATQAYLRSKISFTGVHFQVTLEIPVRITSSKGNGNEIGSQKEEFSRELHLIWWWTECFFLRCSFCQGGKD